MTRDTPDPSLNAVQIEKSFRAGGGPSKKSFFASDLSEGCHTCHVSQSLFLFSFSKEGIEQEERLWGELECDACSATRCRRSTAPSPRCSIHCERRSIASRGLHWRNRCGCGVRDVGSDYVRLFNEVMTLPHKTAQ